MLSQISWTLFLCVLFMMLVLYYLYVVLCYYPKEALSFLLGKRNELPPGTALLTASAGTVMGKAIPEPTAQEYLQRYQPKDLQEGIEIAQPAANGSTVTFPFFPDDEEDSSFFLVASDAADGGIIEAVSRDEMPAEALMVGSVSDLMESIQTLLRVISDGEGDRSDIINFFPSLLAQYPLVADSKYRYSINAFIHDHCKSLLSEVISLEEINDLWYFPYPPKAA